MASTPAQRTRASASRPLAALSVPRNTGSRDAASSGTIRWAREWEERVAEWICRRDKNGLARNFSAYSSRKSDTCERMISELKLLDEVPSITAKKVADKISKMIDKYKDIVKILTASGGGMGEEQLDEVEYTGQGGKEGETIKGFMDRTCHWYSTFDDLLGTKANIRPPVVASSAGPNRLPLQIPRREEDEEEIDIEGEELEDADVIQNILDEDAPVSDNEQQGGEGGGGGQHSILTGMEAGEGEVESDNAVARHPSESTRGVGGAGGGQNQGQASKTTQSASRTLKASKQKARDSMPASAIQGSASQGPSLARRQPSLAPATQGRKATPSMVEAMVNVEASRQKHALDRERTAASEAAEARKGSEASEMKRWNGDQELKWAQMEAAEKEKEADREEHRRDREERDQKWFRDMNMDRSRREQEVHHERSRTDEARKMERDEKQADREDRRDERKEEREAESRKRDAEKEAESRKRDDENEKWRREFADRERQREVDRERREAEAREKEADRELERHKAQMDADKVKIEAEVRLKIEMHKLDQEHALRMAQVQSMGSSNQYQHAGHPYLPHGTTSVHTGTPFQVHAAPMQYQQSPYPPQFQPTYQPITPVQHHQLVPLVQAPGAMETNGGGAASGGRGLATSPLAGKSTSDPMTAAQEGTTGDGQSNTQF